MSGESAKRPALAVLTKNQISIMETTTTTMDCTPTWSGWLSVCLMLIENGNSEGRTQAIAELRKMAKLADLAKELMMNSDGTETKGKLSQKQAEDIIQLCVNHAYFLGYRISGNSNADGHEYPEQLQRRESIQEELAQHMMETINGNL